MAAEMEILIIHLKTCKVLNLCRNYKDAKSARFLKKEIRMKENVTRP